MSDTMRQDLRRASLRGAARRGLRSILKDCSGAVMLEFAFVAGPFFALIFATLIAAAVVFAHQVLDSTAETVAREFMTGQVQKGTVTVKVNGADVAIDSNAKMKTRACDVIKQSGAVFLNCDNLYVSLKKLATFSSAPHTPVILNFNPTTGAVTNAPGDFDQIGQEEIGLVKVYYRWPRIMGPLLGFSMSNQSNGDLLMVSSSIFKTETYNQ